jgi:hypothetical protein
MNSMFFKVGNLGFDFRGYLLIKMTKSNQKKVDCI